MFEIEYAEGFIGAECRGLDLTKPLGEAEFTRLQSTFDERSVLCIRDQDLNETQYIDFAERFGPVETLYMADYAHPTHPKILLVSNIREDGKDIGHGDAGRVWHTDMSFTEAPPRATMLHAREIPFRDGVALGDTLFASAAAAYDSLPPDSQTALDELTVVHDVFGRRKKIKTHTHQDDLRQQQPKVTHPFVRIHPRTGRKCLYVSPGECVAIPGMPEDEALPLIERMSRLIVEERFQYRHQWRQGDILIWDNCAVQHLATFDYEWPRERRLMWRITVDPQPTL